MKGMDMEKFSKEEFVSFYEYICEFELTILDYKGLYNRESETVKSFKKNNRIYLGSVNCENDISKAEKFDNYFLYKEGTHKKNSVDRAFFLLKHIRNSMAHAKIASENDYYVFTDVSTSDGKTTMRGKVKKEILWKLIKVLVNTKKH